MVARSLCLLIGTLYVPTLTQAKDTFFVESVFDLDFVEGRLPSDSEFRPSSRFSARTNAMFPYAAVDGAEVYVTTSNRNLRQGLRDARIAIRSDRDKSLEGTLFWPANDGEKMIQLRFRVDMSQASSTNRVRFLEEKLKHYERLLEVDCPGSAWFRHQVRTVQRELGRSPTDSNRRRRFFGNRGNTLQDTFALLSGGRALSENLQLDRVLPTTEVAEETVALKSIRGINVREYEWGPLVKGLDPPTDSLAELIPDDQHVLFFRSFDAMVAMADDATKHGVPILNLAEPRAEDAKTRARYEQQLGLSLDRGTRLLGPSVIDSVAMTGSDPYFRTGTDVAVLLEGKNPNVLKPLIDSQVMLAARQHGNTQIDNGRIGEIDYQGVRTLDRKLCSYRAVLGKTVVVTNSFVQLGHLIDTFEGRRPSLASLQEYTFFRHRYARDPSETGLVIVSDKTIRRWCGPRWRIATSRRTRAVALMTEIQASHLDQLVSGSLKAGPVHSTNLAPAAGELELHPTGVFSDQFGTLEFQTPIAEMTFDAVTKREADFYKRWRDGYERAWSNFFDPIAVQFKVTDEELAGDVTVMPLIARSEYRTFLAFSQGAKVGDNDGDPHHGTLLHLAAALNRESAITKQYAGMLGMLSPLKINPLSWIDDTIALYVDDGEFFRGLVDVDPDDLDEYVKENVHRLPIALHVGVRSGFQLTAFLSGVRAFIEQSAPAMTIWETLEYKDQPYVRVSASERARSRNGSNEFDNVSLYYAASGDALVLTLNESVLKRSFDRGEARRKIEDEGKVWQRPGAPWIGDNFNVQIGASLLSYIERPLHEFYQQTMQVLCWNNILILNEWKRRYPDRDSVEVHEAYWQRKLVCPGGGRYRWNESWQTMESTVYGHPGEPKYGPTWPASLARLSHGNFGLTFEDDGLRARIQIRRK
jgi:hypothetical protein